MYIHTYVRTYIYTTFHECTLQTYIRTYLYAYIWMNGYLWTTRSMHAGARVRVAAAGMLLKHSINLHLQTVADISIGKIMSLLSNDVHRFDQVRIHEYVGKQTQFHSTLPFSVETLVL